MVKINIHKYINERGLKNILDYNSFQDFQKSIIPDWIDYLKKKKTRINYSTNIGNLELLFQNDILQSEHIEIDIEYSILKEVQILMTHPGSFKSIEDYSIDYFTNIYREEKYIKEILSKEFTSINFENFTLGFRDNCLSYIDIIHH